MLENDENKRNYLIGKVIEYDNAIGKLIGEDENEYTFFGLGLNFKLGDIVKFRNEKHNDKYYAFFTEPLKNKDIDSSYEKLKKI
jgi:hypothetical protein